MTSYSLPPDLEAEVVSSLYQQAAELNWTYLTDQDRTKHYQRWTEDPAIGGRLVLFIGKPENVRPWIKDGPMKEYTRATYGVGKYARYVTKPPTAVSTLVAKALGNGWAPDLATLDIKPLSVVIHRTDEEGDKRFAWGPVKDFKHLVWAAISKQADGDTLPWVVCSIDSFIRPATETQKAFQQRIGRRLDLTITHVTDG
jgi:hypothetical protein